MNSPYEKKDAKEILEAARRDGKVPVSATALKALALSICCLVVLYLAPHLSQFAEVHFRQGTLQQGLFASFALTTVSITSILLFIVTLFVIILAAGFFQTSMFTSFDAVIPRLPAFGQNFGLGNIFRRLVAYIIVLALSCFLVFVALKKGAPYFIGIVQLGATEGGAKLGSTLWALTIGFCLAGIAVMLMAAIVGRALFIFRNR